MKCLVPVKRVIDYSVKIRVKNDHTGVETENVKMSMNPFDEIALEEAVKLKEAGLLEEIIAISIGNEASQETLRQALARGADRAILLEIQENSEAPLQPINIAKILKTEVLKEKVELVLMGKQAIDDDCNQTGQMLAGLLGWSQGTFVSALKINLDQKKIEVTREVDGGLETLRLNLPAVITADLRLNEPRYISLPNLMQAKSKPLKRIVLDQNQEGLETHLKILKVEAPAIHRAGQILENAAQLVEKLRKEAKVI